MLIRMAYRNIFRHKRRTILTLVTMIFGIFMSGLGDGLNQGLQYQAIETYIRTDTAINKIYGKGYYEEKTVNNPLEYLLENDAKIKNILKDKNISSQLMFRGSVTTGIDELSVTFIGVIPDEENSVFGRKEKITAGDFLQTDGIVMGKTLAELLQIKLGDSVTMLGRTKMKTVNAYDITVSGIIQTGNPLMDSTVVFTTLDFAKEFTESNHLNSIAVMDELSQNEMTEISEFGAESISYKNEIVDLMTIVKIRKGAFRIIISIILAMAGLGIVNTMLMSMLERRKEIGCMMANGMSRVQIITLFLYEGLIVGIIGSSIGTAFAVWFNIYFEINGIPMPIETDSLGINMPIAEKLYTYFDIKTAIAYTILGVMISIVASAYPAWKASKLNPADAVRM